MVENSPTQAPQVTSCEKKNFETTLNCIINKLCNTLLYFFLKQKFVDMVCYGSIYRKDHTVDDCILCGRNRRASIPGNESTLLDSLKFCECPQPDHCVDCKAEDDRNIEYTKQHSPVRLRCDIKLCMSLYFA